MDCARRRAPGERGEAGGGAEHHHEHDRDRELHPVPASSARGAARDGDARRDVAGDDRACPDDRALADPQAAEDDRARADRGAPLDDRRQELPVVVGLQGALVRRRARPLVVDEDDPVPDEDLVADLDTRADERVALDLAARADGRAALDLDERPDARPVADPAAVEVRERLDDHALAELDVVDQPVGRLVRRAGQCTVEELPHRRHDGICGFDRHSREDRQREDTIGVAFCDGERAALVAEPRGRPPSGGRRRGSGGPWRSRGRSRASASAAGSAVRTTKRCQTGSLSAATGGSSRSPTPASRSR